jgi:hypothetical protein
VVNGLALTCKFPVWHSWEGPETAAGAYGIWCKPAHAVHVVNNFNFNFNFLARRVRTDQPGVEGIGAGNRQPGSNALGKGARYTSTGMLTSS